MKAASLITGLALPMLLLSPMVSGFELSTMMMPPMPQSQNLLSEVTWVNHVNIASDKAQIRKIGGCDGCSDAWAVSLQYVQTYGSYLEFRAVETDRTRALGFGPSPASNFIPSFAFAIQLNNTGYAEVLESDINQTSVPYQSGDIFRISVEDGVVRYYQNGQNFYTSQNPVQFPLFANAFLYNLDAAITDAMIYSDPGNAISDLGYFLSGLANLQISGPTAAMVAPDQARIQWETNLPSSGRVEYGTSIPYDFSSDLNAALKTSHSVILYNLAPGTTYHYRVISQTPAGQTSASDDNVIETSPPPPQKDTTPPVISDVAGESVSSSGIAISWTTDEDSTSVVEYGPTAEYGSDAGSSALVNKHLVTLAGLTPGTLYHFRVKSVDAAENAAVSQDYTFTTAPPVEAPPTNPNIITDYGIYPAPAPLALPAAGETFTDPTFHTTILRVTDEQDGAGSNNSYSYWPSFNANSTYFWVTTDDQAMLYRFDPENFKIKNKRQLFINTPGNISPMFEDMIWSSTDPNLMFFHTELQLWAYDIAASEYQLIRDFKDDFPKNNLWQMSKSDDDRVFAFTLKNRSYNPIGYIIWNRSTNEIINNPAKGLDEVQIDKTGRYLLIKTGKSGRGAIEGQVLDTQTGSIENLTDDGPDYNPGHSDMGRGYVIGHDNWQNRTLRRNLDTPHTFFSVFDWPDWSQDYHLSLLSENEDWLLISSYGASDKPAGGPFRNEVFLAATDGSGKVRRLAHHQSVVRGYLDSPKANVSRDGRFTLFTSNWGSPARRDTFIIRIPDLQ